MLNRLEGTAPLLNIVVERLERKSHNTVSFLFVFKRLLVHVERLFILTGHAEEGCLEVVLDQRLVEDIVLVRCDLTQTSTSKTELLVCSLVQRHPITKDLLLLIVQVVDEVEEWNVQNLIQ